LYSSNRKEVILKIQKYLVVLVVLLLVASANARVMRRAGRPMVELGPKGTLYIGDNTDFGIGVEGIFNPTRSFGVRLDLAEIRFDNTTIYLNYSQSLDALFYFPMSGWDTYFHAGFGMISVSSDGASWNYYSIRGGLGFNYPISRSYDLFVEPGLIFVGNGHSDVILRIAVGLKFGVL
jgi:hypothetical protein